MGGTSADVVLVCNYETGTGFDRKVGGFPVRLPMVDINTVGAGGGSIAWFDRDGLLKVGPIRAGASPGPACYMAGGDQPTVTDANLILGRLSPAGLLGGAMPVDVEAAFVPVARQLGFTIERTAHGVLGIVVSNMVRAIRAISKERCDHSTGFIDTQGRLVVMSEASLPGSSRPPEPAATARPHNAMRISSTKTCAAASSPPPTSRNTTVTPPSLTETF